MTDMLTIKKVTSFATMFDNPKALWAVNSTDNGGKRPKGNVLMVIKDADGVDITITLPNSWIPIDLLSYTEASNFAKSNNFREAVRKGLITIIDEESAATLIALPQYKEEAARVKETVDGMSNAMETSAESETMSLNVGSPSRAAPEVAKGFTEMEAEEMQGIVNMLNTTVGDLAPAQIRKLCEYLISLPDRKAVTAFASSIRNKNSNAFVYIDKVTSALDDKEPVHINELLALNQNAYKADNPSVNRNIL
jgi:hypothetical protein